MQDSDLPYKFATIWGASATSGYLTAVIPPTATGASASQVLGFPPITSVDPGAGGIPPDIADFNGVLQYLSAWDRWAQAGGPIYFDGSFSTAIGGYPKGAVLAQAATLGQFWISTVENNTSNPDVGGANWDTLLPFAAVNGDATKVFNVANATTATEAVALGQLVISARRFKFETSSTFIVPPGISSIMVSGCAGGAGGNDNFSGGAGQPVISQSISVTPGHTLAINIGAAGAGGSTSGGGNTTLVDSTSSTTLLTLVGATSPGTSVSIGFPNGSGYCYGIGLPGASGPFGGGGGGGGTATANGSDAYGYGAGGGQSNVGAGGSGAPGLIIIEI